MSEQIDWNERYATRDTPWDSGQVSVELKRVIENSQIKKGRCLEIGCGTGTNAIYLAQQGFEVTAVDVSELAIQQAIATAQRAGVKVNFKAADLLANPELGKPFDFLFDRGVYHVLRKVNLWAFLRMLEANTKPGSLYLTLTGNANDPAEEGQGPPRVAAHEISFELGPLFDLVELREFKFNGIVIEGREVAPLAWSALLRRRSG